MYHLELNKTLVYLKQKTKTKKKKTKTNHVNYDNIKLSTVLQK